MMNEQIMKFHSFRKSHKNIPFTRHHKMYRDQKLAGSREHQTTNYVSYQHPPEVLNFAQPKATTAFLRNNENLCEPRCEMSNVGERAANSMAISCHDCHLDKNII